MNRPKQGLGRSRRLAPALFPIAQSRDLHVYHCCETSLRQTCGLADVPDLKSVNNEFTGGLTLSLYDFVHLLNAFHQLIKESIHDLSPVLDD